MQLRHTLAFVVAAAAVLVAWDSDPAYVAASVDVAIVGGEQVPVAAATDL